MLAALSPVFNFLTSFHSCAVGAGMAPMPMPMQGGAPVQMPQGVYMQQPAMYGPPVMLPGESRYRSQGMQTRRHVLMDDRSLGQP